MVNITARPPGATEDLTLQVADIGSDVVVLAVSESRQRLLNPGEPIKFDTTLDGQPVVTHSVTPFYDSCRVLEAFGFTGIVNFIDAATGAARMSMLITEGAKRTVEEGPAGPKVRKHRVDCGEGMTSGRNVDVVTLGRVGARSNG